MATGGPGASDESTRYREELRIALKQTSHVERDTSGRCNSKHDQRAHGRDESYLHCSSDTHVLAAGACTSNTFSLYRGTDAATASVGGPEESSPVLGVKTIEGKARSMSAGRENAPTPGIPWKTPCIS